MANMTNEEKLWKLPIDIEASGLVRKTLATQDTYVDKIFKLRSIHLMLNLKLKMVVLFPQL